MHQEIITIILALIGALTLVTIAAYAAHWLVARRRMRQIEATVISCVLSSTLKNHTVHELQKILGEKLDKSLLLKTQILAEKRAKEV
jgi:hypothetical protein